MLKKFIFFLFISFNLFSGTFQDYEIFIKGKNDFYSGNYEDAKNNFELLIRTFSSSNIFYKNYAYFYIGMNYYKLHDYKKATLYLEKSVYSPSFDVLNTDKIFNKSIFFAERDFYLGKSFLEIGDKEKGDFYLSRIDYNNYYPTSAYYEKMALELLAKNNKKYKDKLNIKFNNDFSNLKSLSVSELIKITEFYASQKRYDETNILFKKILSLSHLSNKDKLNINEEYLKYLINSNQFKVLLSYTEKPDKNYKDLFKYYRGIVFYRLKDFTRALYLFESLKNSSFSSKADFYAASIYYSLGDYVDASSYAEKSKENNLIRDIILSYSYLNMKQEKDFKEYANNIINRYPNSYVALYFNLLLQKDKDVPKSLASYEDLVNFVSDIVNNTKQLPSNFFNLANTLETTQLSEIAKLEDEDILKINLNQKNFLDSDNVPNGYATTIVLEKGNFYSLAFENSNNYFNKFIKYKQLINFCFPKYYENSVKKYSIQYDVPEELIYTIIYTLSRFNYVYISDNSRVGLMAIPLSNIKSESISSLFDPDINIKIGTEKLSNLLKQYKGNKIKTLISYIYGDDYIKNLTISSNNEINFESIVIPEERYFLETLFLTYIFYSRLYLEK